MKLLTPKLKLHALLLAIHALLYLPIEAVALENCKKSIGDDLHVPTVVVQELSRRKLDGYKLIDRVECKGDNVMWVAIPKSLSSDKQRPPDVGLLVSYNTISKRTEISGLSEQKLEARPGSVLP